MRLTTKMMNKIKEEFGKRDNPCSWIGRLSIVRKSVLPNFKGSVQSQLKSQQVILWILTNDSEVYYGEAYK